MTQKLFTMNASGGGGGQVSLRIEGGERLRRFIFRASNPQLVNRLAAQSMKRRLLPPLKQKMPRRTGALIRSLEIRQGTGGRIELWGVFYGTLVRNGGAFVLIPELMEILDRERRGITQDVLKGLL